MFETKLEEKIIPLKELCHHIKNALVGRRALNRTITAGMTNGQILRSDSKIDCIFLKAVMNFL